jgi:3-hydroxyisobutyrate dehydrogenase-like beta-hydroxyacid dehydrogenase
MLDVAISGSTTAADAGTLTLFGGGERKVFEAVQPIFAPIASQWFYMGPSGSGVAMKLVVNTLLGLGMQSIAEAVAPGDGLGLPRDLLPDALAKTVIAPAHAGKTVHCKAERLRTAMSNSPDGQRFRTDFDGRGVVWALDARHGSGSGG